MRRRRPGDSKSLLTLLTNRQIDEKYAKKAQVSLQVTDSFISRLGLEKELTGHAGCVNCLEWNEKGTILASASDDVRFILWDPFRYKRLHTFETGHHGNIFTVKFLPKTMDSTVVTGAGDCRIRVHDILSSETTLICSCHTGRVKRVATSPIAPYLFWSAAEDGMIMQFDLRVPHSCATQTSNVLINFVPHLGRFAEAKCLAINPVRPELLAVGANDPYIRLYDRRMIRPISIEYPAEGRPRSSWERYQYLHNHAENNLTDGCVQYFVAGHLPTKHHDLKKKYRSLSSTYLTFSPSGNDLLVNLGGEQIYLFDINNNRKIRTYGLRLKEMDTSSGSNGYSNGFKCPNGFHEEQAKLSPLPQPSSTDLESLDSLRAAANTAFEMKHYTSAIRLYNKALSICPSWALIYGNRAAAYMKRNWDGDMYAALRDCCATLQIDPLHLKAHFRLAKCLFELKFTEEACECLSDFKTKFPEQAYSRACKALEMDIKAAHKTKKLEEDRKRQEESEAVSESEDDITEPKNDDTWPEKGMSNGTSLSQQEERWRREASDYETRFCGHCNTTTDIKEANFFGSDAQYIVAGSDDGRFFIWDRRTTNIVQVLKGDESIVNCLQPHPTACLLATSGIDPVVRLWSPLPEDGSKNERAEMNLDETASANQRRMNSDPFDVMLMNMGYRIAAQAGEGEDAADEPRWVSPAINCRAS